MFVKPNPAVMAAAYQDLLALEELVVDLRHIALGNAPTHDDLRNAPFLDSWLLAARPQQCLVGHVTGHPLLHGPTIKTSQLWSFDPDQHWARTHSRFYRLGDKFTWRVAT